MVTSFFHLFYEYLLSHLLSAGSWGYRAKTWRCRGKVMSIKYIRRFTGNATGSRREQMTLLRKGGDDQGKPDMILKRQIEVCQITKIRKSVSECATSTHSEPNSHSFPQICSTSCSLHITSNSIFPAAQNRKLKRNSWLLFRSYLYSAHRECCCLYLQNLSTICWLFTTYAVLS